MFKKSYQNQNEEPIFIFFLFLSYLTSLENTTNDVLIMVANERIKE